MHLLCEETTHTNAFMSNIDIMHNFTTYGILRQSRSWDRQISMQQYRICTSLSPIVSVSSPQNKKHLTVYTLTHYAHMPAMSRLWCHFWSSSGSITYSDTKRDTEVPPLTCGMSDSVWFFVVCVRHMCTCFSMSAAHAWLRTRKIHILKYLACALFRNAFKYDVRS